MARNFTIALMAFLTLVDLFATQAILPTLVKHYQVTPAAMGLAVNASTIGMAIAGLAVALFARRLDRRLGIAVSLALLAIPTAALAVAPDLQTFTALRIVQGLALNDSRLLVAGALPAAALALIVQWLFDRAERRSTAWRDRVTGP
jgi:MFS family permease